MAIVEAVNQVKGVNMKFIDHCDFQRPCYVGWDRIQKKHFNQLPTWYMFNYFFEFDQGLMSMRSLKLAPDSSAVYVLLIKTSSLDLIKILILSDLFGTGIIIVEHAAWIPIQLQIAPLLTLSNKKMISLGKKYFLILPQDLSYYPEIPLTLRAQINQTK